MSHDTPLSPASPDFAHLDEPLIPPSPNFQSGDLHPQRGSLYSSTGVSNRGSSGWTSRASLNEDRGLLSAQPASAAAPLAADAPPKSEDTAGVPADARKKRRRWLVPLIIALVLLVVVVVVVAVYFAVIKPNHHSGSNNGSGNDSSSSSASEPASPTGTSSPSVLISGGDGSTVTTESGDKFVYNNAFGGYWYHDPASPLAGAGRPNSWTPPVNESWPWGTQKINGCVPSHSLLSVCRLRWLL